MKILIELPTWLGDTVMVTPAMENIISHYNKPEITIIGSFVSIEIIKNHPKVFKAEVLKKNYLKHIKYKSLYFNGKIIYICAILFKPIIRKMTWKNFLLP